NATWSIMNAGHGEYHESILCYDTYGKGRFTVLNLPEMPSKLYSLPPQVLTAIRKELDVSGIWIDGGSGISLFTYDNKTFGLYCYAWDGCAPQDIQLHIKGNAKELVRIPDSDTPVMWKPQSFKPLYVKDAPSFGGEGKASGQPETIFYAHVTPGEFDFFEIVE
ncbi:MAG: hypothetical protein J6U06_08630, partial [Spirochaetaceae bacterium]|nr:hypothetical protein [Spirochaetaceae bacterium]